MQILCARASKVFLSKIIEEITLPTELLEIDKQVSSVEEPLIEIALRADNAVQMLGEMELSGGRYAHRLKMMGRRPMSYGKHFKKHRIVDLTVIAERRL